MICREPEKNLSEGKSLWAFSFKAKPLGMWHFIKLKIEAVQIRKAKHIAVTKTSTNTAYIYLWSSEDSKVAWVLWNRFWGWLVSLGLSIKLLIVFSFDAVKINEKNVATVKWVTDNSQFWTFYLDSSCIPYYCIYFQCYDVMNTIINQYDTKQTVTKIKTPISTLYIP